jgi:hypothetical protein
MDKTDNASGFYQLKVNRVQWFGNIAFNKGGIPIKGKLKKI